MTNDSLTTLSDQAFADQCDEAAVSPKKNASLVLREAARRLRSRENPQFRAKSMRIVCPTNPMQLEGELEDDEPFFIRYQNQKLTVHVDDHLVEYVETEQDDPSVIALDVIRSLLANTIELPESCA